MDRAEFEQEVSKAVDAAARNGAKWKPLEHAFAKQGVLAGGAISNQQAEQRTRIRQIFTKRPLQGVLRYSEFAVFVLNQDQADRHKADPEKVLTSVIKALEAERPQLPSNVCLESFLILRHDGNHDYAPLALVSWGEGKATQLVREWYPEAPFIDKSGDVVLAQSPNGSSASFEDIYGDTLIAGRPGDNVIFFGPPGTGKSYRIKQETVDFFDIVMTAFHPEYAYSDFVGAYKPVCGYDDTLKIKDFTGSQEISRPIVYYTFEPGVLIRAIVRAHEAEGGPVALVIDELNRGDCAAIFGDFMHLLDRAEGGRSEFGLDVSLPLGAYLVEAGVLESPTEKLFLPANLHIFATINTSDQALYPIDSAFKRRWSWEAIPVTGASGLEAVSIPPVGDAPMMPWLAFIFGLNDLILRHTENEDKRIGPWFIKAVGDSIPAAQVRNKLLYFLWHDVFRGHTSEVFLPGLRTFEAVQAAFDAKGIPGVLRSFSAQPQVERADDEEAALEDMDSQSEAGSGS
ncbi:McrB family protein [Erythrobacter sp. R86502]|uniref:McrB family protein n=1 Tax=Erythrobacter sp. R86502 TaxID=3093846 RepID=UPI0036D31109